MKKQIIFILLCLFLLPGNSPLIAEPSSTALEEAIYTENTLGNLDKSIQIYEQILNDKQTSPSEKEIAIKHLKAVYLKKGDGDKKFAVLTNAEKPVVIKSDSFTQKIRTFFTNLTSSSNDKSEFLPKPWENGQTQKFKITMPQVGEGNGLVTLNIAEIEGRKYWVYEEVVRDTVYIDRYARAYIDMESFKPVKTFIKYKISSYEIDYTDNNITLKHSKRGTVQEQQVLQNNNIYDYVQYNALIQRLRFRSGFEAEFNMLLPQPVTVFGMKLHVKDKEMVEVPMGRFECYNITVEHDARGYWQAAGILWSDVKTHKIVKSVNYSKITAVREMEDISIKPVEITDFNSGAIQPTF